MAKRGRSRRSRRSRRRSFKKRGSKNRVYRVRTRKLRDRKINTLVEKRVVQIARKEIAKTRVSLVLRQFWLGDYDQVTRQFTNGTRVDFAGEIFNIGRIDKIDINQGINMPDIPDQNQSAPPMDMDGGLQGMPTESSHGKRSGDCVILTGVTIGLRAVLEKLDDQDLILTKVKLSFRLTDVKQDYFTSAFPTAEPLINQLHPWSSWGYSAKLDSGESAAVNELSRRTLVKGGMVLRPDENRNVEKAFTRYFKFKQPIKVRFHPADQNGTRPQRHKLWFSIRSSTPVSQLYDAFKPQIHLFTKLHYYEP